MARTPSVMVPLGGMAHDFSLPDTVSNRFFSLRESKGDVATVVMFICNHCPFVKHVNAGLVNLANDYLPKGIRFFAINPNDASAYPEDSPEKMKEVAMKQHYPFPYLYDESQEVARVYQAVCTPDFFVYDRSLRLAYRGQLDDSRPGNGIPVTGTAIRNALDQLIAGEPVSDEQRPSIGCSIKWKEQ